MLLYRRDHNVYKSARQQSSVKGCAQTINLTRRFCLPPQLRGIFGILAVYVWEVMHFSINRLQEAR